MSYSLEEISVSHKCKRDDYIITHLLTQEVPDLHRATTILNDTVDGEMSIHSAHLVLETLYRNDIGDAFAQIHLFEDIPSLHQ